MTNTHAYALELDDRDPLKSFRNKFLIPKSGNRELIYFLGNSLGLQPVDAYRRKAGCYRPLAGVASAWRSVSTSSP